MLARCTVGAGIQSGGGSEGARHLCEVEPTLPEPRCPPPFDSIKLGRCPDLIEWHEVR